MFSVNQKVSYPGQGIGIVKAVEVNRQFKFYRVEIESNGVTLVVPTANAEALGLRPIESVSIESLQTLIAEAKPLAIGTTWNARSREYLELIRSGKVCDVVRAYADLCKLSSSKALSFGERKMLDLARSLLIQELAASQGIDLADAEVEFSRLIEGV